MKMKFGPATFLLFAAAAAAQTKPAAVTPPAYTPMRWTEDYSYLRDPANRTDFFDPIKYAPLGSDDFWVSVGGQFRERYEFFNNNNFGAGPQDDDGYYLTRLLLHVDVHATQYFRLFVQGKSALEDNREGGPRPIDSDELDLEQAFADFKLPLSTGQKDSLTLRVGRQDLAYGAQRLISPLDWANTRRTFQGAKAFATFGKATLDLFWVNPVTVEAEEHNDRNDDIGFWGAYSTYAIPDLIAPGDASKFEAYFLGLNRVANATTPVDSDTYTIGMRFSTKPRPWDLDVEADYQFGPFGSLDTCAWAFAVEGGYTFDNVQLKPRAFLGFDIASGDSDPNDGSRNTFNQLFPLGHAYFGYIDVIGRQNIIDLHPGVELTFLEKKTFAQRVALRTEYHLFWRESTDDAVYNAAGGVLRADGGSDAAAIGSEIDLLLNWQIDRHMAVQLGYSHFFAGSFLEDTGPSDDIDFFYAAFQYTF